MKRMLIGPMIIFLGLVSISHSQLRQPLTRKQACQRFMPSVVRINVAEGEASGFIVTADGWILTAAHVVFNMQTGERFTSIAVQLPDGSTQFGKVFVDQPSVTRDFALLKVNKTGLPYLALGSEGDIGPGSDVSIIGYPFSAEIAGVSTTPKFCMFGSVTATDSVNKLGTQVDAIYFQGPAVKGISGGPIISMDTGRVIGVLSEKLAGITNNLERINETLQGWGGTVIIQGAPFKETMSDLITTLDRHLANGLGAATAIDDARILLGRAERAEQHNRGKKPATHF